MNPEDRARQYWQSEKGAQTMPSIEELRAKAGKFHRKIKRRNLIEYLAGAFVLLWFGWILLFGPLPWTPPEVPAGIIRLGAGLVMTGTVIALWQLHHRTSPLEPPVDGGLQSVLDFQRRELQRQHDALSEVFFWYLLPFIPGLCVMIFAPLAISPDIGSGDWFAIVAKMSATLLATFGAVWWLNKRGARKLQQQINEIDALRTE